MATLILTTVGTAVGGPIGAAVGAIVGQQIDGTLFAPKRRHGPRLGDLAVQTSSYGTQIPKIFGTMRVAGTVIWSTDLKEQQTNSGGGKGQPRTANYSYSASFAVALSGREVRSVRRIWADGKLLRGAAGDLKSRTGFRLHGGTESQGVDPLIASIEGAGQAPAHRGVAYAVFEDFQLADYGNRIPSLTFEVEGDAEPVTIGDIAAELSGGEIAAGVTPALAGYAASGDSVRGAIEALGDAFPISLVQSGDSSVLTAAPSPPEWIAGGEQQAQGTSGAGGRSEFSRKAAGVIPTEVSIAYHDTSRDYLAGLQRASFGNAGARSDRVALPAALAAGAAKSLAEHRLACLWSARQFGKVHLPWRRSGLRAGSHVRFQHMAGLWRIVRWTLDRMVVTLQLVRVPSHLPQESASASPGRQLAEPDLVQGPTTLLLFDLPNIGDGPAERAFLVAAAAGASAGWRGAQLMSSYDGGVSWQAEGSIGRQAVIGRTITKLEPGGSALIDASSGLEVELLNDSMWLESASDSALIAGANLAQVGGELIQFGRAEPIGERRFRLSHFLRGRRGSEFVAAAHGVGEPFLLVDPDRIKIIEPPLGTMGAEYWLAAQGLGDGEAPAVAKVLIEGRALMPPSPVHLRAERLSDGSFFIRWVRRSRSGWTWSGGADAPLAEASEAYRIWLTGQGFDRNVTIGEPSYIYSAAQQAQDGLTGVLRIEVSQVGTHGSSPPARLEIN
jgi:hypothetical protein